MYAEGLPPPYLQIIYFDEIHNQNENYLLEHNLKTEKSHKVSSHGKHRLGGFSLPIS